MKEGQAWLLVAFVMVLSTLTAGWLVLGSYAPPSSASNPVVPQTRQFHLVSSNVGSDVAPARRWVPGTIVVNAGDTVVLTVTNADPDFPHGLGLPVAGINATLQPGESQKFTFKVDRPGIYMFACALEGCSEDHADQKGQLVVLPGS